MYCCSSMDLIYLCQAKINLRFIIYLLWYLKQFHLLRIKTVLQNNRNRMYEGNKNYWGLVIILPHCQYKYIIQTHSSLKKMTKVSRCHRLSVSKDLPLGFKWKIMTRSGANFAHVMIPELSWHVQFCVCVGSQIITRFRLLWPETTDKQTTLKLQ